MQKLFEVIDLHQQKFSAQHVLMGYKHEGQWKTITAQQFKLQADTISSYLLKACIGGQVKPVEQADKVAIISHNRPEWLMVDVAVQQIGAILIPLYPTSVADDIVYILNQTEVSILFIGDKKLLKQIQQIQAQIPTLRTLICFDEQDDVPTLQHICQNTSLLQQQIQQVKQQISENNIATIIYTSGTTGFPKGVMLSHKNICSNVLLCIQQFPFPDNPNQKALSFLPLNHIYEKMVSYVYMLSGRSIYYAESMEMIGDNLREVQPHIFTTVPRLLEKMYEKIMSKGKELKGIKKKIFFWALRQAKQYSSEKLTKLDYKINLWLARKLVLSAWKKALGGQIQYIICGGAACPEYLNRIFDAAEIYVYEGYGPTENSPVIAVNTLNQKRIGTVGKPLQGIQVKLMDDGEICVNGSTVMQGYYKNEEATNEVIQNNWLHTGDIGSFTPEGFLKIIDRKHSFFKTSGGKYVSPQPIENKLLEHPLIEQVMLLGSNQKFVVALIVPNFTQLKGWMYQEKLNYNYPEQAIKLPEVKAKYKQIIRVLNRKLNLHEQIKKFELLPNEWTVEGGELTPKMSIKRKVVAEKYSSIVQHLYANNSVANEA